VKNTINLEQPCSQAAFAELVGVSEAAVSQLHTAGVLVEGEPLRAWLLAYIDRLREQAAGRLGLAGGPDLVHERAGLARVQRQAAELRLDEQRGRLVNTEALRLALSRHLSHARETLLAVPARLAAVVSAESDQGRVHDLIAMEVHHALDVLASASTVLPSTPNCETPIADGPIAFPSVRV
jgi:phage terminase Nu1 subunit (DNA packaging protein)